MNQEKIGKYIQKHEINTTHSRRISKKIGVTNKAISRWENEHGLPDLSLLLP